MALAPIRFRGSVFRILVRGRLSMVAASAGHIGVAEIEDVRIELMFPNSSIKRLLPNKLNILCPTIISAISPSTNI